MAGFAKKAAAIGAGGVLAVGLGSAFMGGEDYPDALRNQVVSTAAGNKFDAKHDAFQMIKLHEPNAHSLQYARTVMLGRIGVKKPAEATDKDNALVSCSIVAANVGKLIILTDRAKVEFAAAVSAEEAGNTDDEVIDGYYKAANDECGKMLNTHVDAATALLIPNENS